MYTPEVAPLSYKHRQRFFLLLLTLFAVSLPFLYLYATGYRINLLEGTTNLVSTGGMYVAAERTGASIYIDDELVRETRVFRRAFYAQNLAPETHKVHVQKEGHHTWVKQLPVYPQLVTEAQAFNLPLVPQVRTISPWRNLAGESVLFTSSNIIASSTNATVVRPNVATSTLILDTEYERLRTLFASSTEAQKSLPQRAREQLDTFLSTATQGSVSVGTSTVAATTTTKISGSVELYLEGDDVFATWVGPREQMPYYYCAEEFELLPEVTATSTKSTKHISNVALAAESEVNDALIGPVQTVDPSEPCDPTVKLDRKNQAVYAFEFFPGSTDFVILALEDGVYVVEIDDRAWQNMQPLLLGEGLDVRVDNGTIYVYDGTLIYQVITG